MLVSRKYQAMSATVATCSISWIVCSGFQVFHCIPSACLCHISTCTGMVFSGHRDVDTALSKTFNEVLPNLLQIIGSTTPVRVTHQIPIKIGKSLSKNSHQLSSSSIQFEHVTICVPLKRKYKGTRIPRSDLNTN